MKRKIVYMMTTVLTLGCIVLSTPITAEASVAYVPATGQTFNSDDATQEEIDAVIERLYGSSSSSSSSDVGSSSDTSSSSSSSSSNYTQAQIDAAWVETSRTEATCGAAGVIKYKNTLTGKTKSETIPATGEHTYEVTEHVDATCVDEGHDSYTCSVCGDTYTETIPATGEHTYEVTDHADATCVEEGHDTYTCSVCGDSHTDTIEATGHTKGKTKVTKKAGLFSEGEETTYCKDCNEVLSTKAIPQICPLSLAQTIAAAVGAIAVIALAVVFGKKFLDFKKKEEE